MDTHTHTQLPTIYLNKKIISSFFLNFFSHFLLSCFLSLRERVRCYKAFSVYHTTLENKELSFSLSCVWPSECERERVRKERKRKRPLEYLHFRFKKSKGTLVNAAQKSKHFNARVRLHKHITLILFYASKDFLNNFNELRVGMNSTICVQQNRIVL